MIGERIKQLRKKKGMYQQDLADALGVAKSTVAMWETEKREPKLDMILKISNALSIPLSEFYSGLYTMTEDSELEQIKNELALVHEELHMKQIINQAIDSNDSEYIYRLLSAFVKLNSAGKEAAMLRVEELTEIPRYTMPDDNSGDTE